MIARFFPVLWPLVFGAPALFADATSSPKVAIPALDSKGDVYKSEGVTDPLIYDDALGRKKMIMVYCDFEDAEMEVGTPEHGKRCLGDGLFGEIFHKQSHGKVSFDIEHVHGWRRMPGKSGDYDTGKTDTHRAMFVQVFALYPEVDFRKYDYIVAVMPRVGNTAFGEREDIAIPYRGGKIKVAMNLSSASPYVFAHEVAHLMGLPDLYTYGGVEGPKNPVGSWDLMSGAGTSTGFLGWHRHKLGWLDEGRKTYLTGDAPALRLTSLDSDEGVSMVVIPADDPAKPSKVFVIEEAQARRFRNEERVPAGGILVYSVDATIVSGHNPVVVFPKDGLNKAPYGPGDVFAHEDAPFRLKVVAKDADGSYKLEIDFKEG